MVIDALEREGLGGILVKPTLGMEDPWFYRNKVQFPIRRQNGRLQMGYFKQRTHEVVNINECYIQDPFITEIAQIAKTIFEERELTAYDEKSGEGLLRHFIGRSAFNTEEILLGIVVNAKGMPAGYTTANEIKKRERQMYRLVTRHQDYPSINKKKRIVGIMQNENRNRGNVILGPYNTNLFGGSFIRERLGRFQFQIQLSSFFQVNPVQMVKLYNLVKILAELTGDELVVDAYAGIGTIAFWLADKAKEVIGIEERIEATKDADKNILLNMLTNVSFKTGLIEKVFPKKADVVVLDPPRGGCTEKALEMTCRAKPKKIIYVSCNPETLARDLKLLSKDGYQAEAVYPTDMFPQTQHIESVAKLTRTA